MSSRGTKIYQGQMRKSPYWIAYIFSMKYEELKGKRMFKRLERVGEGVKLSFGEEESKHQ